MQKPTVGRIVFVVGGPAKANGTDVAPAIITRVWSDHMVNVTVFPDAGISPAVAATSVQLADTEDEARALLTDQSRVAYWPPRT